MTMAILIMGGKVTKDRAFLRDGDALGDWLYELADLIGMHAVSLAVEPYSHWPNGAPSAVLWIEESSITAHCYPERNYIELVLHSCKPIPEIRRVKAQIKEKLGLVGVTSHHLPHFNWRELSEAK